MADIADFARLADETTRMDIADPEGETTRPNDIGAEGEKKRTSIVVSEDDVTSMNTMKSEGEDPSKNIVDLEGKITATNIVDTEARPFDFFRLPRELRDSIYDSLASNVAEVKCREPCAPWYLDHVTVYNAPYPHLLALNKQFSTEYTQRFGKVAKLLLVHEACIYEDCQFPRPEHPLPFIKSVHIDLGFHYSEALLPLYENRLCEFLDRVKNAEDVTIRARHTAEQYRTEQHWRAWRDAPRTCEQVESFTQILRPSTLEFSVVVADNPDYHSWKCLRQTWTAEGGWEEEVLGDEQENELEKWDCGRMRFDKGAQ
ncbi:hypothetical protein LTR12_006247 [Friedmanniomyces endolithicus]|nr:hypothetical protein LTR74_005510 [Friedmanniomyces endolithicus]KAK1819300.1 hypothetical protein LTR12_006247 [Friedmanniomyces endolithicus]